MLGDGEMQFLRSKGFNMSAWESIEPFVAPYPSDPSCVDSFATNWSGLKKIDNDLYLPMFGYKNTEEYYEAAVLSGKFNRIKTPLLCLSADDD